jgi:nucleotide-binding universal stress UspA family protein
MKKILCPTDFSDTAQTAIAYAAKLAQAMQAELTLLNVQSLFDLKPVELIKGKEMAIAGAVERLESECIQISKAFKISCYADVEPSNKALSTVIAAKGKAYDLIVMGSDGPDDVYEFFGGSNTYNALEKSETPMLVIPAGYLYSQINRMVYAYDYLHGGTIPLAGLIPFVRALDIELTVLEVLQDEYRKSTEEHLIEEQAKIKYLYGDDLNVKYDAIRSGEIAQGINSYMLRHQPDALALCTHHRNFLARLFHKSITQNLTSFSSYPVYVFHR